MKSIPKLLSKTKLMRGYRCLKCIYLTIHHPELEAPISPATQALFDQGNLVGAEARKCFPNGVLIDNLPWDFTGALAKTRELVSAKVETIYEAAFEYMGCYARADILQYSPQTQRYNIYEVKSTTKVKPDHLTDAGLQTWIIAKSGLLIDKVHLMHLNTACRYPDLSNLFSTHDITEEMRAHFPNIRGQIKTIAETLRQPTIPDIDIGPHCQEPTDCGFIEYCWKEKNIPPVSIFNLPKISGRKWELYKQGIISLDDPRLTDLNTAQQRMVDAYQSGERFIEPALIHDAMQTWEYPLIFLDFETINPAIPRFNGCSPYMHVPFQFSAHRMETPNDNVTHTGFLHETPDDPRPLLIPALLEACGTKGSIVAYYGKFESDRIAELAQYAPEYSEDLRALIERIVDPLPILRDHVYDNQFVGSYSLKKVAPALLGDLHGYQEMEVADGGAAQRAFEELISPKISAARKLKIRDAMIAYCTKDTQVMVDIVKWMQNLTE